MDATLGQFVSELTKKPGSVVIKSAKIDVFDMPIFEGPEVRLPRLDKKGQLDIPDLAMYTGIANSEAGGRDRASPPGQGDASAASGSLTDSLMDPSTIKSKNPNVPKSKAKEPPKSP